MKTVITTALLLIAFAFPTAWSQQKPQNILAISNVTIVDATGAPAKPNMTVMITGDRLTKIAKAGEVAIPKNAQVIDGTGKFLIPGLWDMHVHTMFKGNIETFFPMFIANGVTGVRDMGGNLSILGQVRKDINEGKLLGPRIIAGQLIDGPTPVWPALSISISDEASARKTVASFGTSGADFIKVYSLIPREAYFALADEAKKREITFARHVPVFVSAREASDAGQKSIEHVDGILLACSSLEPELRKTIEEATKDKSQMLNSVVRAISETEVKALETYSQEKADALFARFAANGTWQAPTLVVARAGAFLNDPNFTNDPRLKYVRPGLRESWKTQDDFRLQNRTAESMKSAKLSFEKRLELVGAMHRAGVKMLAASDALVWYVFPGFSLHDELELFVKAGLSPMEALQTATRNPAIYLGLSNVVGTVETDKKADVVLLEANPLENISNTKKISAVIVAGRLIQKASLDKLLKDAELAASKN